MTSTKNSTQYEDGRIGYRLSRKAYLINRELWNKLKELYTSRFTFEITGNEKYKIYLGDKELEVDNAVEALNRDKSILSEEEYREKCSVSFS
jgi:hypothetical protein